MIAVDELQSECAVVCDRRTTSQRFEKVLLELNCVDSHFHPLGVFFHVDPVFTEQALADYLMTEAAAEYLDAGLFGVDFGDVSVKLFNPTFVFVGAGAGTGNDDGVEVRE
ncbi:hypothetical protein HG531_006739 [Fusarium graminearum]|nr:hypothetical protein HG531_006739 [Fusarium graminearum]